QLKAARRTLAVDELLEELGPFGKRLGLATRQDRRELVAQRQETRGLEPDDRRAGCDGGGESAPHSACLRSRLLDETGGEKAPAAAQRAAPNRVGGGDAIAGARQHALGGIG